MNFISNIRYFSLSLLFITLLISCVENTENYQIDKSDYNFFPLKNGLSLTYQVDSLIYDNNGTIKLSRNIILKRTVIDSFIDNSGIKNYIIDENYTENGKEIKSQFVNVYRTEDIAVENERNLKFIKLIFPITLGKTWEGNKLFDANNTILNIAGEPIKVYENWLYRYSKMLDKYEVNGKEYSDVIEIIQTDTDYKLEKRYSIEYYAKNIGLIYKKMMILNTQKIDETNTPWELKAEEGFIMEQKLIN